MSAPSRVQTYNIPFTMNHQESRSFAIDLTKVLAILLVAFQHAWTMMRLTAVSPFVEGFVSCTWIGVPLFLLVSGSLQISLIRPQAPLPYYAKRFKRILPPFLLWAVVTFALLIILGEQHIAAFIPSLLDGSINSAFWYVYLISGIFLLTPMLSAAFGSQNGRQLLRLSVIIWGAVLLLTDVLPSFALLKYFPIRMRYFGYYVCGAFIRSAMEEMSDSARRRLVPLCALATVACWVGGALIAAGGHASLLLEAMQTVSAYAALLSLPHSKRMTEGWMVRSVRAVSDSSYAIYLSHFLLIGGLYSMLPRTGIVPFVTAPVVVMVECAAFSLLKRWRSFPAGIIGIA